MRIPAEPKRDADLVLDTAAQLIESYETASMSERFAPSVVVPGIGTVTPPGWMWVLGFALGGCEWAIREASAPEFREIIKSDLAARRVERIEETIAYYEARIAEIKAELRMTE